MPASLVAEAPRNAWMFQVATRTFARYRRAAHIGPGPVTARCRVWVYARAASALGHRECCVSVRAPMLARATTTLTTPKQRHYDRLVLLSGVVAQPVGLYDRKMVDPVARQTSWQGS